MKKQGQTITVEGGGIIENFDAETVIRKFFETVARFKSEREGVNYKLEKCRLLTDEEAEDFRRQRAAGIEVTTYGKELTVDDFYPKELYPERSAK